MKQTVLIVENDSAQRYALQRFLLVHYQVILAEENGSVADEITRHQPDLVILDQVQECATIRKQWPRIAMLFLSIEARDKSIVQALDAGADDSMVKPCRLHELEARIRALLRRVPTPGNLSCQQEPESLQSEDGYLTLNKSNHQAHVGGKRVSFTPTEFALVWHLLLHAGKVLSHRALL